MSVRPSRIALLVALWTLLAGVGSATAQRLDGNVSPTHYDLAFDVDLQRARFTGTESIRVTLARPARRIVLHALDIRFQEVTIVAGGRRQRATVSLDGPTQTATFMVPRAVPAGDAELLIRYTGILNDQLRGFYLSQANNRRYAVTQLESTDARRAFPCFDEPAFKATFAVTLTIAAADSAISNGRLLSDTPGPGPNRHTLKFATSPKMSSYLVAIAVGDFTCLDGEAESIPIRICATPDKQALGHIALDAARQILAFYNRYYSIKYPFGKLDVVAVPDFAAGAMENTGAIFYREVDLLADSTTASIANMKRIWLVLAHEIAHQWFGDLVTMQWWNDLWLNEGFATWMEKRAVQAARPEWKLDLDEAGDTLIAMNLDALPSTRSIRNTVETPAEIEGSFDRIAYEKGAAVMNMIEHYVGADVFRAGVNAYLEKHAYGNATSEDFWTAMTAASGKPIDRILPTFIGQPGVPLLTASLTCTSGRSALTLTAERFTGASAAPLTPANPRWLIPICVKTPTGTSACQVMDGPRATIPMADNACTPWAYVNAGAAGYYRTAYDADTLRALSRDVATALTGAERLRLVGDEWALVNAGTHSISDYLTLVSAFGDERTSGIVDDIAERLHVTHSYVTTETSREPFERFVRRLFTPLFTSLGIDRAPGDDDDRLALRAAVIRVLGSAGRSAEVATAARTALDRAMSGGAPLDATAADAVVRLAASRGDAMLWERLLRASREAVSPSERYRYLYALSSFEDPALITKGLELSLTSQLRSQDTPTFLGGFLSNDTARPLAWRFIKEHWNALAPKITISLGDVSLVRSLSSFCDARSRDDLRSFFAAHKLPAASRTLDQTLETINSCVILKEKNSGPLEQWLARPPQ